MIMIAYVLFVPSLIIFAEIERCQPPGGGPTVYYTCMDTLHLWSIVMVAVGSLSAVFLVVFTCLFLNSQFPSQNALPQAVWEPIARAYMVLWQSIYAFHYDMFSESYDLAFRAVDLYILYLVISTKLEQSRVYDSGVQYIDMFALSAIAFIHVVVVLQDVTLLNNASLSPQLIPLMLVLILLIFVIFLVIEQDNRKEFNARDNRSDEYFQHEPDMELYINNMLGKLQKLTSFGVGKNAELFASSPQIFTIISRHMEDCISDDCICKKYEPEFDKKFSARAFSSKRMTTKQISSSFMSSAMGARSDTFDKKLPIKISFESKCSIFMAEIADCIERFLAAPSMQGSGAGVGLKLQKSYFYHAYMNSSYKALFVQLENSYSCNHFRGKVHIYHLKTRIQEEMKQSEASPLNYLDITTCLKFEEKRLIFEQRIVDLCLGCEQFWAELVNKNTVTQSKAKRENVRASRRIDIEGIEDEEHLVKMKAVQDEELQLDDYNVPKMVKTLLDIAALIIDVKNLFNQLQIMNQQSVPVLQSYALVYRYLLRDEYRFEEIVNMLSQLHRSNKLEQYRDNTPMFCDSDDYALLLVSGDVKDLGRILRVNKGVDQLWGYTPDELRGSKIGKLMPSLYEIVHEEFMHSFLKRGHSNFIDKNQFIVAQNKLGFLTMSLSYIKAMVDLKLGLMFVAFYKSPIKVPLTYDNRDGGCNPSQGAQFVRTKDAHYLLCDGKGYIHGMSQNCMRDLGLPPTLVLRSKNGQKSKAYDPGDNVTVGGGAEHIGNQLVSINNFASNIMGPEYEFDLVKGMPFRFDSSSLKKDKALVREFTEIKNRMCHYNVSVTLRRSEYRLRGGFGNRPINVHEILLYTIVINSYSFTDTPNIIIPCFKEEDESISQILMPLIINNQNASADDIKSSKFKEFKAHVQELQMPSKISKLRKITIGFFVFLLGVFSLNYGICVSQNQTFNNTVQVVNILYQLREQIPSTARYVRTVFNIANGYELDTNDVLQGVLPWEDRFTYYMRRISENAENFRLLQQEIYTQYASELNLDAAVQQSNGQTQLSLKVLQSDFSISILNSSLSSSLNLYLSNALQITNLQISDLNSTEIPYIDFNFNLANQGQTASQVQQYLYFVIQNGNEALPSAIKCLTAWSENQVVQQSQTFSLVSLVIAIASMIAIMVVVVPLVYPLLTHYEAIAEIILHTLNKLNRTFVQNEVKSCIQLYDFISHKVAAEIAIKQADKQAEEDEIAELMSAVKKAQSPHKKMMLMQEELKEEDSSDSDELKQLDDSMDEGDLIQGDLPGESFLLPPEKSFIEKSFIEKSFIEKSFMEKPLIQKKDRSSDKEKTLNSGDLAIVTSIRSQRRRSVMPKVVSMRLKQQMKPKQSSKILEAIGFAEAFDGKNALRKYQRKGHLPPILRHASFYERMQFVQEFDSFGEDDSNSNNSSMSNYTNQVYQTEQLQEIKQLGLLDPSNDDHNGQFNIYELSHAKSSDMPYEPQFLRDPDEERTLKMLVKQRQQTIQDVMKKSKCSKLISVSLFVLAISVYLAVNTIYTYYVFKFESQLQDNMKIIDNRLLCYPFSLSVLKEMISRYQQVPGILSGFEEADGETSNIDVLVSNNAADMDREQILRCYQDEQDFTGLLLGSNQISPSVTTTYMAISQALESSNFCSTVMQYDTTNRANLNITSPDYIANFCGNVSNGVNNLGLHEVLNFILRDQENIAIEFRNPSLPSFNMVNLLMGSSLTEDEVINDIFISAAFQWERDNLTGEILAFATYLFQIFDILFGVFVALLCVATCYVGLFYISRSLKKKIVQIYHIVMLIPFGDRTKRGLNELIKIDL